MKYRPHRGTLDESMNEAIEVEDFIELSEILNIDIKDMSTKYYCYDDRIDWDTFLLIVKDFGPLGWTDKGLD